jgi:hypothetical protein
MFSSKLEILFQYHCSLSHFLLWEMQIHLNETSKMVKNEAFCYVYLIFSFYMLHGELILHEI